MTVGARAAGIERAARAACFVALAFVAGCASGPIAAPAVASSPTGGVAFTLWYADIATRQYQYFDVGYDGLYKYGGGMEAFNRKTDWSTMLTAEQGAAVRAQIDQAGWLTAPVVAQDTSESPLAEFAFFTDDGKRVFEVRGADPAVKQFVDSLQKISNQRFDRILQALPEAGLQKR